MNNEYTHITFILDRSGSMEGKMWSDAIGGLKSIIEEQKKDKTLCTFSLCFFDTEIETPIKITNIQELSAQKIDDLKIHPRGGTSLLDALGFSIKDTGEVFDKMAESERPAKVIFMVQTDGGENSSREYRASQIKELIEKQQKEYNWKFMFLSSDIQATNETQHYGFATACTMSFSENNVSGAYDVISSKLSQARSAKTTGTYLEATSFNEEDKEKVK
jgi:uncharacterized protein YegL